MIGALAGGASVAMADPPQAPSVMAAPRRQAQPTHVTVSYQGNDADITETYAVSQKTLHELRIWQAEQQGTPSGKQLSDWLESHGALLDCENGPAVTSRAKGSTYEEYHHNGLLDRQDGPATIQHNPDGSTIEEYYRAGKFVKVERHPSPSVPRP
jgi:hypothetical protein